MGELLKGLLVDCNDFEIVEEGSPSVGVFGQTKIVQSKRTKNKYASKVVYREVLSSDANLNRCIDVYSHISHPSLLMFSGISYVSFNGQNYPTFFTKYMPNKSLEYVFQTIKNQRKNSINSSKAVNISLNNTQKQIIMIGIAAGMDFLNCHRLEHGNLKPSNVLLNDDFYPLITEHYMTNLFYSFDPNNLPKNIENLRYLAPDLMAGYKNREKFDIYSFGLIAIQLLTGIEPLEGIKDYETMKREIIAGNHPKFNINTRIKKELKDLICHCLNKLTKDRPSFQTVLLRLCYGYNCQLDQIDYKVVNEYIENVLSICKNPNIRIVSDEIIKSNNLNDKTLFENISKNFEKGLKGFPPNPTLANEYMNKAKKVISTNISKTQSQQNEKENKNDICLDQNIENHQNGFNAQSGHNLEQKENKPDDVNYNNMSIYEINQMIKIAQNNKNYKTYKTSVEFEQLIRKAAELGSTVGCYIYGKKLMNRNNPKEANIYLKKAAEKCHTKALVLYAINLESGNECSVDRTLAFKYFKMAAEENNAEALFHVGRCNDMGIGTRIDKKEAFLFYISSWKAGYTGGLMKIAFSFENGIGVKKDLNKAREYYQIALSNGINDAKKAIEKMKIH